MLSSLVIAFLPRSRHLLISWLQSPSAVNFEPKKMKFVTASTVSPSICHEVIGPDAMILDILSFWKLRYWCSPAWQNSMKRQRRGSKKCIFWNYFESHLLVSRYMHYPLRTVFDLRDKDKIYYKCRGQESEDLRSRIVFLLLGFQSSSHTLHRSSVGGLFADIFS